MRLLLLLTPLLGGCPPPSQYLITEVTAHRVPVADALVAADCGSDYGDAALRTDGAGRARLQLRRRVDASKCSVVVAAAGFPTVEAANVSLCTTPACPATHVELDPAAVTTPGEFGPPTVLDEHEPLEYRRGHVEARGRDYATPPRRSMEVAQ